MVDKADLQYWSGKSLLLPQGLCVADPVLVRVTKIPIMHKGTLGMIQLALDWWAVACKQYGGGKMLSTCPLHPLYKQQGGTIKLSKHYKHCIT